MAFRQKVLNREKDEVVKIVHEFEKTNFANKPEERIELDQINYSELLYDMKQI